MRGKTQRASRSGAVLTAFYTRTEFAARSILRFNLAILARPSGTADHLY